MSKLVVIDHPLVAHKLSLMRSKATPSTQFRTLLRETSLLLGYEVLRDLPTELRDIETPVGPTRVPFLRGKKLVFVPILRAGCGLLDGLLSALGNSAPTGAPSSAAGGAAGGLGGLADIAKMLGLGSIDPNQMSEEDAARVMNYARKERPEVIQQTVQDKPWFVKAMGNPVVAYQDMQLAAWGGEVSLASELFESTVRAASERGLGRMVDVAAYAKAALYNGTGRYDAAPNDADMVELVATNVAEQCLTPDAGEGMSAFLAKRKPGWVRT